MGLLQQGRVFKQFLMGAEDFRLGAANRFVLQHLQRFGGYQ